MANEVRIRASVDDKVSGPLTKIRDKFDLLGKSGGFKTLVQGVGLGIGSAAFNSLGAAASVAAGFIEDSIKASSNLNEQVNKSNVVFGEAAGKVEKFGDTASRSLGLSKRAALEAAGTFGALFTGVGKSEEEAARMSTTLVRLAADLASFNNLDPGDVLDKLRAGLSGEAEPLRRVGVFLTEAKVKAKAMALGLADANGVVSEGAKITARYALILQETGQAQGDFERTSGSLANQQRVLAAQLEDTQAKLGDKLTPGVIQLQRAFIGAIDTLDVFVAKGQRTSDVAQDMQKSIYEFGKSVPLTGDAFKALALIINPTLDDISSHVSIVRDDWANEAAKIKGYSQDMADKVVDHNQDIIDSWNKMVDALKTDVDSLVDKVYGPIEKRDQLRVNRAEADAQKRIIASQNSTDAEIADAKRRLRELEANNVDYLMALLKSGDITQTEYKRLMTILERKSKTSTGKAKKDVDGLIAKVKELYKVMISGPQVDINVNIRGQKHRGTGERAKGGYVPEGESVTVGEEGIEKLTVFPGGGAYVTPNHKLFKGGTMRLPMGGGGSGNVIVYVNFHTLTPPTQADAEKIGRLLEPAISRRQRERGAIARV